jgi:SAM-dependent methyltransferase
VCDTDGDDQAARRRREAVRERYAAVASESGSGTGTASSGANRPGATGACCGSETAGDVGAAADGDSGSDTDSDADADTTADGGCCTPEPESTADGDAAEAARRLGYDEAALAAAGAANLGLGCGNPEAIADLEPGETVLDLGSGGGFDCFLAADAVGPSGRVVGVDMTPAMVERARETARERDGTDGAPVEFRLGEIEHLPVADGVVDVVISNCVINLSPSKPQVFRDAYRVLRPGGRLAVSDVVATAPVPSEVRSDLEAISACVGGAARVDAVERYLRDAGFVDVDVTFDEGGEEVVDGWVDDGGAESADTDADTDTDTDDGRRPPSAFVGPASITARKPESTTPAGDNSGSPEDAPAPATRCGDGCGSGSD